MSERPTCRIHRDRLSFGCEECRAIVGYWQCTCGDWHMLWRTYCRMCTRKRPASSLAYMSSERAVRT